MDKFIVEGDVHLQGEVRISGSKNAALPILCATLLCDEPVILKNVPQLRDISTMIRLLQMLGMSVERDTGSGDLRLEVVDTSKTIAPYELVSTMRASVGVLGPLLATRGTAKVALPGGCLIGSRPIDLHLKGLKKLGVEIKIEEGYILADGSKMQGTMVYLGGSYGSSVLATANLVMAAVLTSGTTILEHAACEPEIIDLCEFLSLMGAEIWGIGSSRLTIQGVERLHGGEYAVIPDRIEAGTFMVAAAITHSPLILHNVQLEHQIAVVDKLQDIGVQLERVADRSVKVIPASKIASTEITTLPYPGFPTDMQAQFMALLCFAEGGSLVTEKIFPDRFIHASEMNRMGAHITKEGASAFVKGVSFLTGAQVMASDLRASAALVLAAISAKGQTEISRVYHIDRGYERIEEKFAQLGAKITRSPDR